MSRFTLYVVDDEESIRQGLSLALGSEYLVHSFGSAEEALQALDSRPPDLVLLDIGLPGMSGVTALGELKRLYPEILVIMITAYEDLDTVVTCMKQGAYDYVVKPLKLDALEISIRNALETIRLRKEVQQLQERYLAKSLPCFISESRAIQDVMELVEQVARSPDTPVLILGETGTGKELLASAIHGRSPNFQGPFVSVNCAAIPRDLLESELFGYERGAFTGARSSGKRGLIEEAENGTLFLDEVGDLGLEAQAKLLRFLEEGEFYRVGSSRPTRVQTRVVSATNRNLDQMIAQDRFRKDLYFRLGVITVQVPSLAERPEDILPLAQHFLWELARKFDKSITSMSAEVESALLNHPFTGNVRELRNLMERAVLTCRGHEVTRRDLGLDPPRAPSRLGGVGFEVAFPELSAAGIDLPALQEELERFYLVQALDHANGNESGAARLLHLNHHTFRYRRRKLGIAISKADKDSA